MWTDLLAGRKHFLSKVFQQQIVPLPCSTVGLHGSEYQQLSRVTEEHNSPPPCGQPSIPCWVSSTIKPQLFIHKPMIWLRDSTGSLKTLYELGWQLLTGTVFTLGSPGSPYCSKSRFSLICCRGCLWFRSGPPSSVLTESRSSFKAVLRRS